MAITSAREKLVTMVTMSDAGDPSGTPVPPQEAWEEDARVHWRPSFLGAIIGVALIAIAFTAGFLGLYEFLSKALWFQNDFVLAHRWTIPAGVLIFSLLVGLCQKYLHAPTVIHGGFVESMKEEGSGADYRTFPGAFLSSLFSLVSGASIGPEGTIAIMVGQIAAWIRSTFRVTRVSERARLGFDVAALASAFNGIVGSPVFTGVFATEIGVGRKDALTFLLWNLVAGLVGYLFYFLLGFASFAAMITFPPLDELSPVMVVYAIFLGVVGSLVALFAGLSMKGMGRFMEKTFGEKVVLRTLAAGAVTAAVCFFFPVLLFSGEVQIHDVLANPAVYGIWMLLLFSILKLLLLALAFKGGYIGGPIFPVLFASTMVGLGLSLAFPGIPVAIFVLCVEAAAIALALGAPLTAILLVVVVSQPNQNLTLLIVTSAITALVLGATLKELMARRTQKPAQPVAQPA
jgi:H+/Cl- antiporter ClcA